MIPELRLIPRAREREGEDAQTFTVAFYGSKVFCRKTAQFPETARNPFADGSSQKQTVECREKLRKKPLGN